VFLFLEHRLGEEAAVVKQIPKFDPHLHIPCYIYRKAFLLRITSVTFPLIFLVAHAWYSNAGADAGSGSAPPTRTASTMLRLYRIATVISAFSVAIGMAEGTTVMIKQWVKRRRPNFYALCEFDIFERKCTSSPHHIKEVRRGHIFGSENRKCDSDRQCNCNVFLSFILTNCRVVSCRVVCRVVLFAGL